MATGLAVAGATLIAANQDAVGGSSPACCRATAIPGSPSVAYVAAVLVLAVGGLHASPIRAPASSPGRPPRSASPMSRCCCPSWSWSATLAPADGSAATAVGRAGLKAGTAWVIMLLLRGVGLRHRRVPDRAAGSGAGG